MYRELFLAATSDETKDNVQQTVFNIRHCTNSVQQSLHSEANSHLSIMEAECLLLYEVAQLVMSLHYKLEVFTAS